MLEEIQKTMERRVNAAMHASQPAKRYGSVDAGREAKAGVEQNNNQDPVLTSEARNVVTVASSFMKPSGVTR